MTNYQKQKLEEAQQESNAETGRIQQAIKGGVEGVRALIHSAQREERERIKNGLEKMRGWDGAWIPSDVLEVIDQGV